MRLIASFVKLFWQWFRLRLAFAFLRSARFCEQRAGKLLGLVERRKS